MELLNSNSRELEEHWVDLKRQREYFARHNGRLEVQGHEAKVHAVGWSCCGTRLATGSFDRTVSIYNVDNETAKVVANCKGHDESVDQLCWHPHNQNLLITASTDKTVKMWDARINRCVHSKTTKGENINVTWSSDGKSIAIGNKDDLITFIDAESFEIVKEHSCKIEVNEISWNRCSDLFFMSNGHGCIDILRYPDLEFVQSLKAHPANCICLKFDLTGKYFATGSADALVSLWDTDELVCLRTFSRLDWPVRTVSFSYDSRLLASGSEDLAIDISHIQTGEHVAEVGCNAPTFAVAWSPNKPLLAFACDDKDKHDRDAGTVQIYGLSSRK
ncbi:uncharacterized protein TRIADDRAFT_20906 [Trichoplax adhaerens]|uniref:Uncharacterized protein n=1 Tax=Trichoplax adhaerens TaxID=10228 RepID=B3RNZ7_TRIAD|nr:hypothetical protein TRIADDRAFT_20906 [Trichoplax adhaerens]EDV28103.1 hypothetical protein TRIADDRAFT_20906 [Trichoplax adhaerens]|eukprot:XP_002109937.1 hypothetical protein TRIADDRAFT_20906 [Trichoplax adhaerens]